MTAKKNRANFFNNSYFHAFIGAILTAILSFIILFFILHNTELDLRVREIFISIVIAITIAFFTYVTSIINKLLSLLKSESEIINKLEEYVDNRIRRLYLNTLNKLKGKDYEHFTDFILEVTDRRIFTKSTLSTIEEIRNLEYKDIISNAIDYSKKKSFNSTLTGEYLPHWFFNDHGGMKSGEKLNHLKNTNEIKYDSKRLMIFKEEELEKSFGYLNKSDKKKFLIYHDKTELYWIDKEKVQEVTGIVIDGTDIPDCILIDDSIGLHKKGNVLKIIVGDKIDNLKIIFNNLNEAINKGNINNGSPFKDKKYINEKFKAKDE